MCFNFWGKGFCPRSGDLCAMKLNQTKAMTTSAITSEKCNRPSAASSLAHVLNLLGVIAGAGVALISMIGWGSPIGFFCGLAGALYCLDGVRQSW